MKIISVSFFCVFLVFCPLNAQIINKTALSERITGYKMDVSLDTGSKTVKGSLEAYWVNKSSDTVPDIQMHLYMNAFRSNRTTYYSEMKGSPGNMDSDLGWIEIRSFRDKNGVDLLPSMEFISPDDGNMEDKTVARILLPKPALPDDTVSVRIDFETKLPSRIRRTGYTGDFYFVAQWFPKFGVYEPAGMRYSVREAGTAISFMPIRSFIRITAFMMCQLNCQLNISLVREES